MAMSLPEMLRVKRRWVASELDVATVRDDHYPVVVDFEAIVCLPKAGNRQRKALFPVAPKPSVQRGF